MSDPSGFFDPEEEEVAAAAAASHLWLPDTSGGRTGAKPMEADQESGATRRHQPMRLQRTEGVGSRTESGTGSPSLGTWSVILVALGVLSSPVCLYLSLAELHLLSLDPAGNALKFLTLGAITSLVVVVGCGFAVAALFRGQPRTRPVVALAIAFLAGPLLTLAGASLGLDTAQDTLRSDFSNTAGRGGSELAEQLEEQGVDFGPLDPLVQMIIAEGSSEHE